MESWDTVTSEHGFRSTVSVCFHLELGTLGVYKGSNHAVQMILSEVSLGGKRQEHCIFHMVLECCILGHELVT